MLGSVTNFVMVFLDGLDARPGALHQAHKCRTQTCRVDNVDTCTCRAWKRGSGASQLRRQTWPRGTLLGLQSFVNATRRLPQGLEDQGVGRVDAAAPAEWAEGRPPWRSASGGVGSSRRSSDNLADEGGVARAASLGGRPDSSGAPAGACAVLSCCISWTYAYCNKIIPCEYHKHQWPNCWGSLQTVCVETRRCSGGNRAVYWGHGASSAGASL